MITAPIKYQDGQQAISLLDLATEINAKHGQTINSARTTLESARDAGQLLITAKSEVDHGRWAAWLDENCPDIAGRTARKYMQIADNWGVIESKMAPEAILTIGSALRLIAEPEPTEDTESIVARASAAQPAGTVATQKTPEPATPIESTSETEVPEIVQRVQSVLRSHFNEDELPT